MSQNAVARHCNELHGNDAEGLLHEVRISIHFLKRLGTYMDDDKEREDEATEEKSFAELLEESSLKPVRFNPGQKVTARIVKISSEWVFLDLGGKSEGYLERKELLDEDGNLTSGEGDMIQAYFLSTNNNDLRFTTRITGGEALRHHLEEAWESGIPVEGMVEKEIKGGFEIKIAGELRGFCPYSQMGLQRIGNPNDLIGQHLPFRITQYGERGRNVVLSHRSILEEERQLQKEALKGSLHEGMKVTGRISSIRSFGAFVTVGAAEGLIPISEIAWDRVEDVQERLAVGQEVEVVALKLDWEKDRLSFSLKRALPDPWTTVEKDFPEGSSHHGTVVRLMDFGAFVTLAPGVDGLLHISKLGSGKRINHPREVVSKGQVVEVKVESIDKDNKRLSLSLAASEQADDQREEKDDFTSYLRERPDSMGTLADLLKSKLSEQKKQ
jgi:small subunit ribosomal protein S1